MAAHFEEMMSSSAMFSIVYGFFCFAFACEMRELDAFGMSPDYLMMNLGLADESTGFIQYHILKSVKFAKALLILPLVWMMLYTYFVVFVDNSFDSISEYYTVWPVVPLGFLIVITALTFIWLYTLKFTDDDDSQHPLVKKLQVYCEDNTSWRDVANSINEEFRSINKTVTMLNSWDKLVVTDNWIIVIGSRWWTCNCCHKTDATATLVQAENHQIATDGQRGGTQYLHVKIKNQRPGGASFNIRLNVRDYRLIQDKLGCQILNKDNLQIFESVSERFIEVFREEISNNPRLSEDRELEPCIGCMVNIANVKLSRRCDVMNTEEPCVTCYCRPMWCNECMARWFASKQDQNRPETWLSSKCPCPTCRSKFCIVDVCFIAAS